MIDRPKTLPYYRFMSKKRFDFLPEHEEVLAYTLARLPYGRTEAGAIAEGANPESLPKPTGDASTWGLFYETADAVGFFAHASESPMDLLIRSSSHEEAPRAVHLKIAKRDLISAVVPVGRKPANALAAFIGRLSARFFASEEETLSIRWKDGEVEKKLLFFGDKFGETFPSFRA